MQEHAEKPAEKQGKAPALTQKPQPAAAPPSAESESADPAWAGSPETAAAKESVRQDASAVPASALSDAQVDALGSELNVPTPSQLVAREGGIVGPELVAEMQADPADQELRRRAIGDAYQVVMAGAAVANGQPGAEAAVEQGPPELKQAAQDVAREPAGGSPLPESVRAQMEGQFGEDFSSVQVHVGSATLGAAGAGAATAGEHIHFAPGKFDPETQQGQKLIAHELTHVVQQRGASASGAAHAAASDSAAEHQAEAVGEQVAGGQPALEVGAEAAPAAAAQGIRGTAPADAVHFGEAGVHRGIELEAAGVGEKYDPKKLTPQQRAALEMYAGNFMRDYSQLAAPTPLKILAGLPSTNKGGVVGNAGARTLIDAIVRSIAILELGKDVGKQLVTQKNVGSYEAEHHLDNPMGTSGAGDFITEGPEPKLASKSTPTAIRTTDALGLPVTAPYSTADSATQATHAGSAAPGLQYENPELYKVGEGGLATHLSNSTEHAKNCLLESATLGASPSGRMKLGMGQHIVEDYFSHSNFIEVGLNTYINDALKARREKPGQARKTDAFIDEFGDKQGKAKAGAAVGGGGTERGVHAEFMFVDTLYDQKTPDGKQAITTGTFGGDDSQVSIGHVLLPKLPIIEKAMHKGIDSTFGVVDTAAKAKQKPTWELIKQGLDTQGNEGAAAQVMLEASKSIGLAVPCPSGFHLTYKQVGLPLFGSMDVPNGVDLSYTNVAVADALVTGASTYVDVMERLESLKKAAGLVGLQDAITSIQDTVRAAMQKLFAAIRAKVTELIRQIIVEMYHIDPKQAAHAGVDELTHVAERQMHEKTEKTSIQSRLGKGGDLHGLTEQGDNGKAELERRVGPVRPKHPELPQATHGTRDNPWVTVNALPPSHSEISKDHPPHHHDGDKPEWHAGSAERDKIHGGVEKELDHQSGDGHDHEDHDHESLAEGSSFYGLHRALAVEADRHMMRQMEQVWGAQLIPGKNIDEDDMAIGHGSILAEAKGVAGQAAKQAGKTGLRHAQSDSRVSPALRNRPEVMQLLDLVDYFLSHPTASSWWRKIFDSYISQHAEEVHGAILARNQTRGRRK